MENNKKTEYNLDKILSVASVEYVKWICNARVLLYISMLFFLKEFVIREFIRVYNLMKEPIMIFEPFVSIGNSNILLLILPAVFLTLMGDFPKTDGNTMFYIQRTGKKNWIIGQLLFSIYANISFISVTAIATMAAVVPYATTTNKWSSLITTFGQVYPKESRSKITYFINGKIYNNMTPSRAFGLTFAMMFLLLLLISMTLLAAFSIGKRIIGIGICASVMAIGMGLVEMGSKALWLFPTGHAIMWTHYDKVLKEQIVSIRSSYLYFVILLIVLILFSFKAVKHYDFAKISDMED